MTKRNNQGTKNQSSPSRGGKLGHRVWSGDS
jgi:hypothetical protein